ncbi:MAG TPA: hypothetical protein VD996_04885 [Chitinophagaceae bacterium]|nr:hypothetical protein [Chitinophagaceae bacterium]
MTKKELKEFKAILHKQQKLVQSSPEAARELLQKLGMLTRSGKLKKAFRPD